MEHTFGIGHVFSQEFPGEHLVGSIGFLGLLSLGRRARRIGNGSLLHEQLTASLQPVRDDMRCNFFVVGFVRCIRQQPDDVKARNERRSEVDL